MFRLIKKLIENDKIRYLIGGGTTTLVNLVMFFLLRTFTGIDRNMCNFIAIITAIVAAYFINKLFVFRSHAGSVSKLIVEMLSFVGVRLLSMVIEVLGFSLLCDSFRFNELASKIIVQFIVIVANYVFSKLFVFNEKKTDPISKIKNNWSIILSMVITFIFMLVVMIVGKVAPFGDNGFTVVDSIHQYVPFFSDFQDKLINERSIFYTWNVGMGINFMSLLLYYMASPLNLVIMLFKRHSIHAVMSCLISLKIVFSAGAFSTFLSRRKGSVNNNILITAFGVAYALNSYVTGYYWNIMWLDCIMVLPLIILGFEKLMKGESPKLYAVSLFYALYCNYYIAFMICIFLILWFFATKHSGIKKFFIDGFKFAGASLLAAGMAAFSLFTAYFAIMKTATAGSGIPKWEWYGNIFKILERHTFLTTPMRSQQFDGGANLYCGILIILLFFLYLFNSRIPVGEKLRKLFVIAVLVVSFNATTLNFVWHGFHDQYGIPNRFAFVYIFTLLVMGYDTISRIKGTEVYYSLAASILSIAFIYLCRANVGLDTIFEQQIMFWINIGMILLYLLMIIARQKDFIPSKVISTIIAIAFMGEIIINAGAGYMETGFANCKYYLSDVDLMKEAVEIAEENSKEMGHDMLYRSDMINPIMLDEASLNGMKSIGTFCSTVRGNVVTSMNELGFYTGANEYLYDGATAVMNMLFGVRYIYTRNSDFYPPTETTRFLTEHDKVFIYENKYVLPFGYAVSNDISNWRITEGDAATAQNLFLNYAVGTPEVYERYIPELMVSGYECDTFVRGNDCIVYESATNELIQISASFTVWEDGEYYFNCRGNYMNKLKIYIDGSEEANDRFQTQMARIGELRAGQSVTIEINFGEGYSPNGSVSLNIFKQNNEALELAYKDLSKEVLNVTDFADGYIKGEIDLEEDKTLFTSVLFDEGWSTYIDGERVDPTVIGDAFMAFPLSAGHHEIEMKYFPDGLIYGALASLISWILFFVIITKKKKNNEQISQ